MRRLVFLGVVLFSPFFAIAQDSPSESPEPTAKEGSPPAQESETKQAEIPLPTGVELPVISRSCSPEGPRIGTPVSCVVSVTHDATFSVAIEVPPGFQGNPQQVITKEGQTQLTTSRNLTTTPLSMRKLKVFGFKASWSHQSGARGMLRLPDEYMVMTSMMADIDDPSFRTFRQPTSDFSTFWTLHGVVPLVETNWFMMIGLTVVVAAALLAWLINYVQRRRAERDKIEAPWVDPRPAHVIANEALERLAADSLPEKGMVLEFYLRLSEILRVFLENRFGIAIERGREADGTVTGLRFTAATSEEIETVLRGHPDLVHEGFESLLECLSVIDYVIFGGIRPHVGQTEADRRRIRFCIELNKAPELEAAAPEVERLVNETVRDPNSAAENGEHLDSSRFEAVNLATKPSDPLTGTLNLKTESSEALTDTSVGALETGTIEAFPNSSSSDGGTRDVRSAKPEEVES